MNNIAVKIYKYIYNSKITILKCFYYSEMYQNKVYILFGFFGGLLNLNGLVNFFSNQMILSRSKSLVNNNFDTEMFNCTYLTFIYKLQCISCIIHVFETMNSTKVKCYNFLYNACTCKYINRYDMVPMYMKRIRNSTL